MRQALLAGFVLVGGVLALHRTVMASPDEESGIPYPGYALGADGTPVAGVHEIVLRFFDDDSEGPRYVESHSEVVFDGGRFNLVVGTGVSGGGNEIASFQALTTCFESAEIEVIVDGSVQTPRIAMVRLTGGLTANSRFLGAKSTGPFPPSIDGAGAGRSFSLQAVTLRPKSTEAPATPGEESRTNPYLVATVFRGTSPSLRTLPSFDPTTAADPTFFELERGEIRSHPTVDASGSGELSADQDPLVVDSRAPKAGLSRAPDLLVDVEGLPSTIFGPPDSEGAVGPDHYVQGVNISFRIFDKQGEPLTEPIATNALWANSGSVCESDLYADLVIAYDEAADRWVLIHLAADFDVGIVACIAVSTGPDPTGEYFLYELQTPETPDYPKIGVWPDPIHDAYFIGTNPGPPGTYDVFAIDRESLLAGIAPRPAQRFTGNPNFMMPADLDGSRRAADGSPGIFYTFRDGGNDEHVPGTPVDSLDLYEFAVDWENPAQSTLTHVASFTPPEFAPFNYPVCSRTLEGKCLSQPDTGQLIDDISWLPMQRLQYRNLARYETLVGLWTVNAVTEGEHAALRWFELRRQDGGDWQIAYQGTFAPDDCHRWMGSVALDGSGNMAMGYNVVNADAGIFPSLRYTVRLTDTPRFLTETTQVSGTGSLTESARWGDYSSMEVDPADHCTFWFTGEYVETSGPSTWSTRIGAFRVPGCTGGLRPPRGEDDVTPVAEN